MDFIPYERVVSDRAVSNGRWSPVCRRGWMRIVFNDGSASHPEVRPRLHCGSVCSDFNGIVRSVPVSTNVAILRRLTVRHDGEPVPTDF
jgi:hypothetical protein